MICRFLVWIFVFHQVVHVSLQASEVASVTIRPQSAEVFSSDDWFPANRPTLESQMPLMRDLVKRFAEISEEEQVEIKVVYADRAVVIDNIPAKKLLKRIDKLCEKHAELIEVLRDLEWAADPESSVMLTELTEHRKGLQAICRLAVLHSLRDISLDDVDQANRTLNSAFALSRNCMLTTGEVNHFVGLAGFTFLLEAVLDLQRCDVGDLSGVLSRLEEAVPTTAEFQHVNWLSIRSTLPLLTDRPRTPADWLQDSRESIKLFSKEDLIQSEADAEEFGRQLQTLVQVGKRFKRLRPAIQFEHGGMKEFATKVKTEKAVRFTPRRGVVPITNYVEEMLDPSHLAGLHTRCKELLTGAICIERLRSQAAERGLWLRKVDSHLADAMPEKLIGFRPVVTVEETGSSPSYLIQIPNLGVRWNTIHVQTDGALSK